MGAGVVYDLTAVLRDVLVPVLAQLLRPGELERVDLRRDDSTVWVELTLRGEVAHLLVWTGGPALNDSALRARISSDLQDFLAESTVAWGQWREYVEPGDSAPSAPTGSPGPDPGPGIGTN